jgi:two-component system, OmpR family, response regulator CpxR
MPLLSIFSGIFCKEETLPARISQRTGYALVSDDDVVSAAGRLSGMSETKIEKAFSSRVSVFNKFTHERERSIAYLKLALAEMLPQDNLVISGFSSHLIPKKITHVLRVCLIADIHARIASARQNQKISETEAHRFIRQQDEARAFWVNTLYGIKDPWDAALYDIVAPTDKMDADAVVDLIVSNLGKDVLQVNTASTAALDDFKLAANVEVLLANEGHQVGVNAAGGVVTLTINKPVLLLSRLEDELKELVKGVSGVKAVETKVGPEYYQADIYRKSKFEMPTRLLLVDDEREFVQTLSERLLIRDMGSAVAYDGESALSLIKEDAPEVMILDLQMPGINGIEVLRRVKKTNPNIAVIILTGHGSQADRETCMQLGAFAYLQKPVNIDELTATIKKANEYIVSRQNR